MVAVMDYRINGATIVGFGVLFMMAAFLVLDGLTDEAMTQMVAGEMIVNTGEGARVPLTKEKLARDPNMFMSPYPEYILTQGVHGQSYGHMAIDIKAGKGKAIGSPINGTVSALFFDGLGNSVLVIENERYEVTMLHGVYSVEVGQSLAAGDPVGKESNIGNTVDWQGKSCRGRDCGYHTHLNVFDKSIKRNVDPLALMK